jgi:hypothetical protein
MSTTLYLRCISHDPYIQSDDIGHNLSYLDEIKKDIRNRKVIVESLKFLEDAAYDIHSNNFRKRNLWWFLFHHPDCELQIWDEYNRLYRMVSDPYEEHSLAGPIDSVLDNWGVKSDKVLMRNDIITVIKDLINVI